MVYRFLHQQNLIYAQLKRSVDRRKFEAELSNDLWQSDVMDGPKVDVNGNMRKSYLIMESTNQVYHSKLTTDIQSRTYQETATERLCRVVFYE